MKQTIGIGKYYIGFGALAVFVIGVLILVLSMAAGAKQDKNTYDQANKIAEKLNSYTDSKRQVPSSLSEAGISSVPGAISYTKTSDSTYKFCATYKSASSNFNVTPIDALTGSAFTQNDPGISYPYGGSSYTPSALYIDPSHKKGENCQTVKIYIPTNYCSPYLDSANSLCPLTYQRTTPTTTTTNASSDYLKKIDAAKLAAGINVYISNNAGVLPNAFKGSGTTITIGSTSTIQNTVNLGYYTANEVGLSSYVAGVSYSVITNRVDVLLKAACSGSSPTVGTARNFAILYSLSTGVLCQSN